MTPDPADLRNIACWHVVGELSVLCLQVLDLVGLMMRGCEPCGNCTVSIFLCLDYVIRCPVYKSDPLYGLDLSLLLKGLTLQRYPVPRVHPSPPIAGLRPGMDSDRRRRLQPNSPEHCPMLLQDQVQVLTAQLQALQNQLSAQTPPTAAAAPPCRPKTPQSRHPHAI